MGGYFAAAECLLKAMQQPPVFEEAHLAPALNRAASPRDDGPYSAEYELGYNSAAGVRLLLGVLSFSKAALQGAVRTISSSYQKVCDPSIVALLLDAAPQPWSAADFLPVLPSAVRRNKIELVQKLVGGVDGVRFTAESLIRSLQVATGLRDCEKMVQVLLSATSAAWTKQDLLSVLSYARYSDSTAAHLVLQATPQPWTSADLLGPFNKAASDGMQPRLVKCLLEVEEVEYPPADLSRALQAATSSGAQGSNEAVEALLKVAPRCSLAVLEAAISTASNKRKGSLKTLLQQQHWTYEQLWPLVCEAITKKKDKVLDQLLAAGQNLPWDLPSLLKALYDVSMRQEASAVLVVPLAKAAAACKPNPSSRRSSRCRTKKGSRPPGGGSWEAKHFCQALYLAAKGRRPGTVSDLLQLPGLVWSWDDVRDAWEASCRIASKATLKLLLQVPGVWTTARVAECVREAAKQGNKVVEAMLKAKQVELVGSGSKGVGAGHGRTRRKRS